MSRDTKREPTAAEAAAIATIRVLTLQIADARRIARPEMRFNEGTPYCPWCGGEDLQLIENTPTTRRRLYQIVTDPAGNQLLPIGDITEYDYENCHDDRFECRACWGECRLPDTVTIHWK